MSGRLPAGRETKPMSAADDLARRMNELIHSSARSIEDIGRALAGTEGAPSLATFRRYAAGQFPRKRQMNRRFWELIDAEIAGGGELVHLFNQLRAAQSIPAHPDRGHLLGAWVQEISHHVGVSLDRVELVQ